MKTTTHGRRRTATMLAAASRTASTSQERVDALFVAIVAELFEYGRVYLPRLGVLKFRRRRPRTVRTPTGQVIDVPGYDVVKFVPLKELRVRVRAATEKR